MTDTLKILKEQLEELCDQHGDKVLTALKTVCYEKAIHVVQAWQDEDLAKQWEKAGKQFSEIQFPYKEISDRKYSVNKSLLKRLT